MILAAVSSGRSLLDTSRPTKRALARVGHGSDGFHGSGCHRWRLQRRKPVPRTVIDLDGIGAIARWQWRCRRRSGRSKVSAADHLGDVAICATSSLAATRGAAFLPLAVAGNSNVAVAAGHGQHLGGQVLGQAVFQGSAVGVQYLGHASDLGGGLRPQRQRLHRPPARAHRHRRPWRRSRCSGWRPSGWRCRVQQ